MDQTLSPLEAYNLVVAALSPRKRSELAHPLDVLSAHVEPKLTGVRAFWADPICSKRAKEAMREAWNGRRTGFELTWRTTGDVQIVNGYADLAPMLHRSPPTIMAALRKGKGTAYFADGDDIITVRRL